MSFIRRVSLIALVSAAVVLGSLNRVGAQQQIVIDLDFDYIRQGSVGVITLTGPDLTGAQASAFGRAYPFFPTSKGFACLLSVAYTQPIKDYPIQVTLSRQDGSKASWDGTIKVASGEFVAEDPFSLPADKLNLLRGDVQQSEDTLLESVYKPVTPIRYWEGAFTPPVNAPFSSPFGSVRLYNNGVKLRHTGYDLKAAVGTPVMASASGRVVLSRPLDIHGDNIVIDHGWGVYSEYAHLSERYVVPGQFVLQGDVIGLSGNTGRSTGPHVHWEIAVNGNWVNPRTFMQLTLPN
jgi:murein DD-endopeptidase MepM/ murein hydrolase activator NlpD